MSSALLSDIAVSTRKTPPVVRPSAPPRLPVQRVEVLATRLFNRLSEGSLSALVLPEASATPEAGGIRIVDERNPLRILTLQMGRTLERSGNPALLPGYKVVEVMRPESRFAHLATLPQPLPVIAPPSMALRETELRRHNCVLMFGISSIHATPLADGGTVLLRRDGSPDVPTRVAVAMHGDMPGIAPGYLLVTPPQRQAIVLNNRICN